MLAAANLARFALRFLSGYADGKVRRAFDVAVPHSMSAEQAIALLAPEVDAAQTRDALQRASAIVQASQESGVRIVSFSDAGYPKPLRSIAHPPPFIHVRGAVPEEWSKAVAVVGTREPSQEALQVAGEAVQGLSVDRNAIVVSGLALGIDTAAHRAALACGLRTIAVVAHGLQTVFPETNEHLAREIVANGGCCLCEIPLGGPVTKSNLVARDRLQSGLSIATAVVQTSLDGGTMHTALFALQQGRRLLALEPLASGPDWSGNDFLVGSSEHPVQEQQSRYQKFARPYAIPFRRAAVTNFFSEKLRVSFE